MNRPRWDGKRWRIQARRDGKRYSFSSSLPGIKGRKECQLKYDNWYYGESTGEKSVKRVCQEYLDDLVARRGKDSPAYDQNEQYIRLHIVPKLGDKKMCKTTLRDWQNLINNAKGQKGELSEKSLKNLRAIISAVVKFGYQDYQCEPLRGSLYIPKGHSHKEKEILQKEDVRRLFEPSDLWYHPMFCLGVLTGMRPGELLGIRVSDIKGNRIFINRAVNAKNQITEGKNENARRMVPIGKTARAILDQTIARNERYNLRTEWVFCSPDGSVGNQSTMRNHWNMLKKERNLPGSVYSLRHTFISLMKNTMPETMIKDIVGHSASMPTMSVYGHFYDGEEIEAAKIVDLTLGATFGANESTIDGQSEG